MILRSERYPKRLTYKHTPFYLHFSTEKCRKLRVLKEMPGVRFTGVGGLFELRRWAAVSAVKAAARFSVLHQSLER